MPSAANPACVRADRRPETSRDGNADLDDDNDGQIDADETTCGSDPLDDTSLSPDNDGDDSPDCVDPDDDNDGVDDGSDAFPFDPAETADTDGDGTGDNADLDDDNDGQTDADETTCGSDPLDDTSLSPDNDGDDSPDCVDPDDDNDGFDDAIEVAEGSDPFDAESVPPGTALDTVAVGLEAHLSGLDAGSDAAVAIADSLRKIDMALGGLADGRTSEAIVQLLNSVEALEAAGAADSFLDLTAAKALLTAVARTAAMSDIDTARDVPGGSRLVARADASIVNGDFLRDGGSYSEAVNAYKKAVRRVQRLL